MHRLILLPGMDGTGELFREFSAALPEGFHTTAVCYLRDRFCTDAELVRVVEFMSPEDEPFVLLAESYSTPVAIQFAANHPANLRGVVLCAGFATSPAKGLLRRTLLRFAPLLLRGRVPEFAVRRWLVGEDAPDPLVANVRAAIASVQPAVLAARLRAILACDVRAELRKIKVPVLYLQARGDRVVKADSPLEIQEIKPDVSIETIDGPHLLLQWNPRKSAEVVAAFFLQCQRSEGTK